MKKDARGVRHLGRSKDRRVRRTEGLLHQALASLIHEKAYDAIAVKEILARADVGRSTFYSHFRDKDDLLASGIRDMVRTGCGTSTRPTSAAERVLRFSLPILEHIERFRRAGDSSATAPEQEVVHEHLERVLVELIADDLRLVRRCQHGRGLTVPPDLLARHLASTFVLVLDWWVASEEPLPASKVHDVFRALVVPALRQLCD